MSSMRAVNAGAAIVALLIGAVVMQVVVDTYAVSPVAAQAPTIGPTNTAAAETAVVGLTAIAATDVPPTPAPTPPAPPTPVLTPTPPPALQPTPTGTPHAVTTTNPSSLGSAAAGTVRPLPAPAGSTGGSSAWPVVGVLIAVAAIVAAGIVGTRVARRRSRGQ